MKNLNSIEGLRANAFVIVVFGFLTINAIAQETPVLSFHQSQYSQESQTYTVDVRANGRVIYKGGENTRHPPFAVFDIDPAQLKKLLAELDALQLEEDTRRIAFRMRRHQLDLTYTRNGVTKTVDFPYVRANGETSKSAAEFRVRELLEQYIPIESLRCPAWVNHYDSKPPKDLVNYPEVCEQERKSANASKKFVEIELNILRQRSISK